MAVRTTLNIDDDVMCAAKEIAAREQKTVGEVISELARQTLHASISFARTRSGVVLLPLRPDAKPVTLEHVNELRDELDEDEVELANAYAANSARNLELVEEFAVIDIEGFRLGDVRSALTQLAR
jgi:hypothetical protein